MSRVETVDGTFLLVQEPFLGLELPGGTEVCRRWRILSRQDMGDLTTRQETGLSSMSIVNWRFYSSKVSLTCGQRGKYKSYLEHQIILKALVSNDGKWVVPVLGAGGF